MKINMKICDMKENKNKNETWKLKCDVKMKMLFENDNVTYKWICDVKSEMDMWWKMEMCYENESIS